MVTKFNHSLAMAGIPSTKVTFKLHYDYCLAATVLVYFFTFFLFSVFNQLLLLALQYSLIQIFFANDYVKFLYHNINNIPRLPLSMLNH
jgi:hypothetical protein